MTINFIKYIDPRSINNNNFESSKDLEKYKARVVEAVGYFVSEDEDSVYIAMQISGPNFRKVLFVPKKNIVERLSNDSSSGQLLVDGKVIVEKSFIDTQMTPVNASITFEKLKIAGKPEPVNTVGFLVRDGEDTVLAMERNEDGKFRTQIILPKVV